MEPQTVESNNQPVAAPLHLDFLPQIPVLVQPTAGQLTSDAGLLPIRQFDARWNYTARMAACLDDPKPRRGQALDSMLRQRIFGILAGYEDCNDHDTLRDDPVFKLIAERKPDDAALASQPTLSRFENLPTPAALQKLIDFTIATGIERLRQHHGGALPAELTLDLDATDDPTHGHQQLTLFHGYYGQYQYFPLIISEPTTKHVFVAWLRPGTVPASLGADDDLLRVVAALRKARPDIRIHVRGDAGFGLPRMYEVCEQNDLTYTFGLATSIPLQKCTAGLMQLAVAGYEQTKDKQRRFDSFAYQCDSWDRKRQVIAKAECHAEGTNLRFVVTNRPGVASAADGEREYDHYIQRGESEQRMDELKNGLSMDRLSCHRFLANFFRLQLHVAAMNLLNAQRDDRTLPEVLRKGQPCTWRTLVIKVAAVVVQSTRRVLVQLAGNWPWWPLYQAATRRAATFLWSPAPTTG
jgi:hypothetical protein